MINSYILVNNEISSKPEVQSFQINSKEIMDIKEIFIAFNNLKIVTFLNSLEKNLSKHINDSEMKPLDSGMTPKPLQGILYTNLDQIQEPLYSGIKPQGLQNSAVESTGAQSPEIDSYGISNFDLASQVDMSSELESQGGQIETTGDLNTEFDNYGISNSGVEPNKDPNSGFESYGVENSGFEIQKIINSEGSQHSEFNSEMSFEAIDVMNDSEDKDYPKALTNVIYKTIGGHNTVNPSTYSFLSSSSNLPSTSSLSTGSYTPSKTSSYSLSSSSGSTSSFSSSYNPSSSSILSSPSNSGQLALILFITFNCSIKVNF